MTQYHINTDRTAAVSNETTWIDATEQKPPKGVKLLVINRKLGVAHVGPWADHYGYTHWQALPRFAKDES